MMIIGADQIQQNLDSMQESLKEIRSGLRIEQMQRELAELKEEMAAPVSGTTWSAPRWSTSASPGWKTKLSSMNPWKCPGRLP